jgi:glycosyltransferase involved in cell wall biosynthesis
LLVRSLEVGGAERQLVELAKGLKRLGQNVVVGVFYKRGALLADLEREGIKVVDLRKTGRWDVLGFLLRTRRAVSESKSNLLYSFLGGANIVAAAVRMLVPGTKLVWSIRSSDMDLSRYDWLHGVTYRLERLLSEQPELIISNSYAGRDFALDQGFPPSRVEIVPNGVDTDHFRPNPQLRAKQRVEWGLSNSHLAVGVLARLDPMKDQSNFLRAAAIAAEDRPELHFLCIGEGPERARLMALAAELGIAHRVNFAGRADPLTALNALDLACSSSAFGEGFSNAVGEAMACAVPCVVTDVGDSRLIVGDTGIVVARSNPDALASAILNLIGERQVKGERARRRIEENFSVHKMISRTYKLLTVVSGAAGPALS